MTVSRVRLCFFLLSHSANGTVSCASKRFITPRLFASFTFNFEPDIARDFAAVDYTCKIKFLIISSWNLTHHYPMAMCGVVFAWKSNKTDGQMMAVKLPMTNFHSLMQKVKNLVCVSGVDNVV